jgi:succinoglycan biosynthesis transport protein ExoP
MDGSGAGVRDGTLSGLKTPRFNLPSMVRDQFDVGEMFAIIRRRRGIIFGTIGLITLLAVVVLFLLTPKYTSDTLLLLDPRKTNVIDMEAVVSGLQPEAAAVRSEVDVLRSRQLAGRVIEKLGLIGDPEFNDELKAKNGGIWALLPDDWRGPVTGFLGQLHIGPAAPRPQLTPEQERERTMSKLTDKLLDNLVVANDQRSYTIKLMYTAADPVMAQRIVNTVADLYLVSQLEAKFEATKRANDWLSVRVADLKNALQASEQAVQVYREQNKLNVSDAKGTGVTTQQLGELNTQLVMASADRAQKEARLRQFQASVRNGTVAADAPEVLNSP